MWAEPVGPGRYRILSIPFRAEGISCYDVVEASSSSTSFDEPRVAERLIKRSGHSTYRLSVFTGLGAVAKFDQYWEGLAALSCRYERADAQLVAVDVPPQAPEPAIAEILRSGEEDGVWQVLDGLDEHPVAS